MSKQQLGMGQNLDPSTAIFISNCPILDGTYSWFDARILSAWG
jgi:hypothetical protein